MVDWKATNEGRHQVLVLESNENPQTTTATLHEHDKIKR